MATRKKLSFVEKYLKEIAKAAGGHDCIYRGLPNARWRSENSAARRIRKAIKKKNERIGEIPNGSLVDYHSSLLGEMRQKGFGIRDGRELNDLEMLADLQHFEAATCLLDFTESPLVALYFACANEKAKQKDGKLFILRNANLNTVLETDPIEKIIKSGDLLQWRPPMHGEAERRIIRQSGVFIINLKPREKNLSFINIPKGDKQKIINELREKYQISEETLFIDLAGFAKNHASEKPLPEALGAFYCGNMQFKKKNWSNAIEYYDEAIRLKPDFANAYYNRGVAKNEKGDLDDAIKDYTDTIRLKPDYVMAHFNRSFIKAENKDWDGAITGYSQTIRLNPNYADAYFNRAVVYSNRFLENSKNEDLLQAQADAMKALRLEELQNSSSDFINKIKRFLKTIEDEQEKRLKRATPKIPEFPPE